MWSNPQNPAQWAIWAYAVVSDFKYTGAKMFLLKLLWEFPKFNRCENIKYKLNFHEVECTSPTPGT